MTAKPLLHTLNRSLLAAATATALALAAAGPVSAQAQTTASAASTEYRLGAGDIVRISVYQNPDLTLETRVSESGVVSYPLLGSIKIGGLAPAQAEKVISDGLKNGNFVKQPQVTVLVIQVRGNQVSVLGQVNRPGRFPIEVAEMRLSDMLANAGGIAGAGAEVVTVVGTRNGQPFRAEVDLPRVFTSGGRADDLIVQNGDVIWVDRAPMVYIYGEVQRPGPMRLERGMTLMQTLATGGGLTQRGTEKGIRVHRKDASGKVQVVQLAMDESLRDGDVVYVKESLF
ncbi:MAG: polysaccharide export protein EpsE [Burkholderiaceae bacterium]|nr:polysaccharide export protein EpsE [Burkholderiaceae bacterium]MBT9500180.1 polysaccharide export protein EpsE [Burkholderiaceae bacterium]